MNPLLDQLLVALFVTGAIAYFALKLRRRRAAGKTCGSGCCAPTKELQKSK